MRVLFQFGKKSFEILLHKDVLRLFFGGGSMLAQKWFIASVSIKKEINAISIVYSYKPNLESPQGLTRIEIRWMNR